MKYVKSLMLLIVAIPCLVSAAGNSGWRNIKNVRIESASFIAIYPTSDFDNPDNCGKSTMAMIPFSDISKEAKLSVALAAYMGGKRVQTYMMGCESTPWGYTVPVVYNLVIGD